MRPSFSLSIAIVGAGYTSAALLMHLLERMPDFAEKIAVFGRGSFGHGAAFGTLHPDYRLNVRAQIMQLRPTKPDLFPNWAEACLQDEDAYCEAGKFYRRVDFARYIDHELSQLPYKEDVKFIRQHVISVRYEHNSSNWHLRTDTGEEYTALTLILATGNPEPDWPCPVEKDCLQHEGHLLIKSPWTGSWLHDCDPEQTVLLVGGGLTALDTIYALGRAGHRGKIHLVTPLGILPPAQTGWVPAEAIKWPDDISSASAVIKFMMSHLNRQPQYLWTDSEWQSRFEALRVHLNPVWRRLPAAEKRRLMVHLGGSWSLARYRSAPQTSQMAAEMISSGQLVLHTGRVNQISAGNRSESFSACLSSGQPLKANIIVNCTGIGRDPLIAAMIGDHVIQADAFGWGPQLAEDLKLCSGDGDPYPFGYGIGAMTAGSEGDVVGATTIARQAASLAHHLTDGL
tara:strand:+ start:440 stop:1807 length:1368 start_codon:yes stop_codon:yes gene_type:complete